MKVIFPYPSKRGRLSSAGKWLGQPIFSLTSWGSNHFVNLTDINEVPKWSVEFHLKFCTVVLFQGLFWVLCWLNHCGMRRILGSRALSVWRPPGIVTIPGWEPFSNLSHHKFLRGPINYRLKGSPPHIWISISIGGTQKSGHSIGVPPRSLLKPDKLRKQWFCIPFPWYANVIPSAFGQSEVCCSLMSPDKFLPSFYNTSN